MNGKPSTPSAEEPAAAAGLSGWIYPCLGLALFLLIENLPGAWRSPLLRKMLEFPLPCAAALMGFMAGFARKGLRREYVLGMILFLMLLTLRELQRPWAEFGWCAACLALACASQSLLLKGKRGALVVLTLIAVDVHFLIYVEALSQADLEVHPLTFLGLLARPSDGWGWSSLVSPFIPAVMAFGFGRWSDRQRKSTRL